MRVRRDRLCVLLGLLIVASACGMAACGQQRGGLAGEVTPTATRTPRPTPPAPLTTAAPSPLPAEAETREPTDAPTEELAGVTVVATPDAGEEPTPTPQPPTATPTPTQTPNPTAGQPADDALGDEVEALLEELLGLFEQADPLDDAPGGQAW